MKDIGRELNRIEKICQMVLRVSPAIKRRIRRLLNPYPRKSDRSMNMDQLKQEGQPEDRPGAPLEVGDTVEVLSYSQIESTLNDQGYLKGLSFQKGMEKYCNRTYRVLKIPQYVLDQGGRKINRCKDVVILQGLYCNGKDTIEKEGCDRSCLHYWKTDWLRKVV
jgi:hypothetical protein